MKITIKLTPSGKKNEIKGWETNDAGERYLRVQITAAPEKGKANEALIKLLAKHYDTPKSAITLIRGETSRVKTLEINAAQPSSS